MFRPVDNHLGEFIAIFEYRIFADRIGNSVKNQINAYTPPWAFQIADAGYEMHLPLDVNHRLAYDNKCRGV